MNITDELVERINRSRPVPGGTAAPKLRVAIVACMDARINPNELFQLENGDAHIIRNAGGLVTDDVVRSLAVSQHRLGTRAIMVIQHADCGMKQVTEDEFTAQMAEFSSRTPGWKVGAFQDVDFSVRNSLEVLRTCPFLFTGEDIRGFVFDEKTGELREVAAER